MTVSILCPAPLPEGCLALRGRERPCACRVRRQIVEDRAVGTLVAVAMRGKVFERPFHRLHLFDASRKLADLGEGDALQGRSILNLTIMGRSSAPSGMPLLSPPGDK